MHPSVVKEPGCPFQNADRPTRRHARRWGDLASPAGAENLGPHGPGSFPPACTLLLLPYHDCSLNAPVRPAWPDRPPIPVHLPATFGVRWSRNAEAMAPGPAVGPVLVSRGAKGALALIEPFVLHSRESRQNVSKSKSRVSMVLAVSRRLCCVGRAFRRLAPNVEPGTCGTRLPSSGEHVSK